MRRVFDHVSDRVNRRLVVAVVAVVAVVEVVAVVAGDVTSCCAYY